MEVRFDLRTLSFEWDSEKAQRNYLKHGVSFEEAAEVFFDILAQVADASQNEEARLVLVGYTFRSRLLLVVHMERGERIRLISARAASRAEQNLHEEQY